MNSAVTLNLIEIESSPREWLHAFFTRRAINIHFIEIVLCADKN